MTNIQIGTSTFESNDFLIAVQDEMTCGDCKHCQINKKVADRTMDWTCYHEDNSQNHLYGKSGMSVDNDFLCNKFEEYRI